MSTDEAPVPPTQDAAPVRSAARSSPAVRDGRPSWTVVAVALSVAVLSLGFAVYALLFAGGGSGGGAEDVRDSALEAARERTLVLTSYDHRTLDANFKAVLDRAVGQFKTDYVATTTQLRPTFTSEQAVAKGTVVAAGLESAERDRAVVVVAVDQVITTRGKAPRTERNRLRMTLVRPDGTWLVEAVERL